MPKKKTTRAPEPPPPPEPAKKQARGRAKPEPAPPLKETKPAKPKKSANPAGFETPKRPPGRPKGTKNQVPRAQWLPRTIALMEAAAAIGRPVTQQDVMNELMVVRNTARALIMDAKAELDSQGRLNADGDVITPTTGKQVVLTGSTQPPEESVVIGIDMTLELQNGVKRMIQQMASLELDLRHARYFLNGSPEGHEYPGFCRDCGAKEVSQLTLRRMPAGLQVGYTDIARLSATIIRAQEVLAKHVTSYNDVLAQLYNYNQLENYINNVRLAVKNVCPQFAKELAAEIRRLQVQVGGVHGLAREDENQRA